VVRGARTRRACVDIHARLLLIYRAGAADSEDMDLNNEHHHNGEPKAVARRRDWRHVHHSPLFWVGVVMFLAAISIYVLSDDLALRLHFR